mgnify:CR=1 FL=1
MKDIKGFCKLFDLNVPVYEEFDYYVDQLSKIYRWKNLRELIRLYEKAEEEFGDLFEYRIKKSNELIQFLQNTRAYNELNDDNLIPDYPTTKNFQYDEGIKYLSIDIRMANWVVLKKYDPPFLNELGESYDSLLDKFGIPELFRHSKQFRQYIFGNINPKKQGKAQRVIIEEVISKYRHLGLEIACVKNDEIIYSYTDDSKIKEILNTIDYNLFKVKLFTVKRIKDFRINLYTDENGNFTHKEMVGCNGNHFFMFLKKYILEEPFDIRDLYFRMDGNIAIWVVNGLNIKLDD